jgi:tripartite ATP-independent transporter DctP family solute receptor
MLLGAGGAGIAASAGLLRAPASAAEFSYKLGNDQTPTHPMTIETIAAAKRIFDASGGRVDIRVFPNSSLGNDPQMLAQARSGALEFLQIGNNVAANVVPAAALESIPFAFASYKELMSAANGELGTYIGEGLAKAGLQKFKNSFYGGSFQMQSRLGPVASPADLKGLKIRVPPGPIDVATFKAFGGTPTVISLGDVYTALQTHIVDAIEVPLPTIENFKFYELVKYSSQTAHSNLIYILVANQDAWAKLPKKWQDLVEREFGAAALQASAAMLEDERSIQARLEAQGVAFNRPPAAPFRKAIRDAGLYPQWRDLYGAPAWELLEKVTGKLT